MTLTTIKKAGLDELALDHVFTIGASGSSAYTFQGEGLNGTVNNPTLYLTRGKTYRFENGSGGHPIRIQSTSGASGTAYNTGVTNNAGSGTVIVEVQHDAPDVLYYQCTSHAAMNGVLYITGALADGGVTTAKIADDAVTAAKIADGTVTAAQMADNSSPTRTIQNSAVTTIKIADNAVTAGKLASGVQTTINNNADNRVITGSGTANTLNGESNAIIDSSGHMGLGVTPNANWPTNGDYKALQVGTGASLFGRGSGDEDRGGIAVNYYSTGSGNKYLANGHAARIYMNDGRIDFNNAAENSSGANASLTFSTPMSIDSSGKVGIGTTSPARHIHLNGSDSDTVQLHITNTTTGTTGNDGVSFALGSDESLIINQRESNHISLKTADTERMRIDSSGRLLVGGQDTALGIAGGNSKIQVQATDSTGRISIVQNRNEASGAPFLSLAKTRGTALNANTLVQSGDTLGTVAFAAGDGTDIHSSAASIVCKAEGTPAANHMPGVLQFNVTGSGDTPAERMRIDSSGKVGIGETAPLAQLHIKPASNSTQLYLEQNNAAHGYSLFVDGPNGGHLKFMRHIDGSETQKALLRSDGGLCFGTDSAAANALDDYEEGTWTPLIRNSSGTGTGGGSNYGYYTKVGNVVHAHATVHWTALNSGATSSMVFIVGLPYASKNASNYRSTTLLGGQLVGVHNGNDDGMNIAIGCDANMSSVYVTGVNGSATSGYNYTHYPTVLTSGAIYGFSFTYLTNS
jgi:hypothetical protein